MINSLIKLTKNHCTLFYVIDMGETKYDMQLELLFNDVMNKEANLQILIKNSDQFFLIVIAIIIFFMQCGFAFLEAGSVR